MNVSHIRIGPVEKVPVEARATEILRKLIVAGKIAPGSRITEVALSDEMQLSRATIRTALHQLLTEGLISLVPYTGWTVVPLTSADVWELYTLRSALERLAAQLVAAALGEEEKVVLQKSFDDLVCQCEKPDRAGIAEADFSLHKKIISLSRHNRLEFQYRVIEQQIRMYIRSSDALIAKPAIIIDQHRPIVSAILAGEASLAGHLSEQHNLVEGEKLSAHLRKAEAEGANKVSITVMPVKRKAAKSFNK